MRRLLLLSTILTAVALALLVGACGGDNDDDAATTSVPASQTPFGGGTSPSASSFPPAFVQCMADKGADVTSSESIHSAQAEFQACLPYLHGG